MEQNEISYKVIYRKIKHPRIELRLGKVILILPHDDNPERLLNKYWTWIENKLKIIKELIKYASKKKLVERTEEEFKKIIHDLVKRHSEELKVSVSNIFIRRMRTKWASYSKKGNLTINRFARYLPNYLLDYIVYHELVHSKEKRHNDKFWSIIAHKFPRHNLLEEDLFTYWFLIFRNGACYVNQEECFT